MAEEVKLWKIGTDGHLGEISRARLEREELIERWIEGDVSILGDDLLLIGRQVNTDFGGTLDLLAIDAAGDLVVLELKRGRTPREVTAQVLDYASWVDALSSEQVLIIANEYLGKTGPLEPAFQRKFRSDLPETLNGDHRMVVVASEIDPSTERIIHYLSECHGVNINAATFQHFRSENGESILARVFLIEPSEVEYKTRTRRGSKRQPNLTYEQLKEMAEARGVGEIYIRLTQALSDSFARHTTRSSFAIDVSLDGGRRTLLSLIPGESSNEQGLRFQVYAKRLCKALKMAPESVQELLPEGHEEWRYYEAADDDYSGYAGYFRTMGDVEPLIAALVGRH